MGSRNSLISQTKKSIKSMTETSPRNLKSHIHYEDINFEEIDEDLATFQEDEMVQQALHRGVDLIKYGNELDKDLRIVSYTFCYMTQSLLIFILFPAFLLCIHFVFA
jgi:hypothetical protein